MAKKFIVLFLSFSVLCSICGSSCFAYNVEPTSPDLYSQTGYLIDESGNVQAVVAELVNVSAHTTQKADEQQLTYKYRLASTDYSLTANPVGYGIDVYITIKYKEKGTPTQILLTSVQGNWEITDSRCSVTASHLFYGCTSLLNSSQKNDCAITNNFVKQTGYTIYVPKSDDAVVGSVVGAYACFRLLMGSTRKYTFVAPCYICGSYDESLPFPDF